MRLKTGLGILALAGTLVASPAFAEDAPKTASKTSGSGGDAGGKPNSASMVVEEAAAEAPPPAPMGAERDAIGTLVRAHSAEVQDCYTKALEKNPKIGGQLKLRFDIGPNGKVIGANSDGIPEPALVTCVVAAVRKWEFAKPASGGKLRVVYPFRFQ